MSFVKGFFRLLCAFVVAMSGTVATRISYGWDGTPSLFGANSAFVDMFNGRQPINHYEDIQNSGWIDVTNTGRPFFQFHIECLGQGQREIEVLFEHGQLFNEQILKTRLVRHVNVAEVDYYGKTLLWEIPIDRQYGPFARIKAIYNKSDFAVIVQALAPASAQPVDGPIVLDYEVPEEEA